MSNNRCAVCGHVNRVGVAVCEMCDTRLGEPARPFGAAAGGFGASGESYGGFAAGAESFGARSEEPGVVTEEVPLPQFKGMSDVFSPTLEVYRKHFLLVGILVAVTTLPVALLQYGAVQAVTSQEVIVIAEESAVGFGLLTQGLLWLFSLVGNALLSGALVYAVVDLQRTGAARAGESLRRGLKVLPRVFIVTLLYTIATSAGYLLLIIPGVILSLMYSVAVPVAVAENRGPFESMKRSAALTDGYRGLIFLTFFLWGLLILVLNVIVTGSFAYGGAGDTLSALLIQSVIAGMLTSSSAVLTVYIYLGLLRERDEPFITRTFTPGPAAR